MSLAVFIHDSDEERELSKTFSTEPLTEEEKVAIVLKDLTREAERIGKSLASVKKTRLALNVESYVDDPHLITKFIPMFLKHTPKAKKNIKIHFLFAGTEKVSLLIYHGDDGQEDSEWTRETLENNGETWTMIEQSEDKKWTLYSFIPRSSKKALSELKTFVIQASKASFQKREEAPPPQEDDDFIFNFDE